MYAVWERRATGYYYRCAALLYEILAECRAQSSRPARGAARIRPSLDYLHENYKRHDLTVGEIARASFVSEVYLRRLFKEAYGTSPQKYLMELRIRKALDLLGTGYYTLKEVAELSGYADYKYFSVEFKRAVGVSPSAYLREGGKAPPLRATR